MSNQPGCSTLFSPFVTVRASYSSDQADTATARGVCRDEKKINKIKPLQQKHLIYLKQTRAGAVSRQSPSCDLVHLQGLMGAVCLFTVDTLV